MEGCRGIVANLASPGTVSVVFEKARRVQNKALLSGKHTCECVSVSTNMMSCHLSWVDILADIQSDSVARGHRQPTFSLEMDEGVSVCVCG